MASPLRKNVLESTSYLLPLASKTNFTELHGKPSRAPTLPCLPCCTILACSKVGSWDYNSVILTANFLLLVITSQKIKSWCSSQRKDGKLARDSHLYSVIPTAASVPKSYAHSKSFKSEMLLEPREIRGGNLHCFWIQFTQFFLLYARKAPSSQSVSKNHRQAI
jgi:hypothetical protein